MILNRVTSSSINHKNVFKKKSTKHFVLQNGFRCGTVKFDNSSNIIRNTCPFDVIVQILFTTAVDDSKYFKFMQTEENEVFNLVFKLIENGPSADVYKMRFTMLKPLFEHTKVTTATKKRVIVNSYDATGSPADLWRTFFENTPSTFRTRNCENCGEMVSGDVSLMLNHNIIIRQGFRCLQKALNFSQKVASNCECGISCTEELVANYQIFIELEIRPGPGSDIKVCRLKDIPTTLLLNAQYRLVFARKICYYFCLFL